MDPPEPPKQRSNTYTNRDPILAHSASWQLSGAATARVHALHLFVHLTVHPILRPSLKVQRPGCG